MTLPSSVANTLQRCLGRLDWALKASLRIIRDTFEEVFKMATQPSEELLAAPLPELIRDLGLAVAGANAALAAVDSTDLVYTVDKAEIELNVAISIEKQTKGEIALGGNIAAFSVNASYARTFGYKEEASSRIVLSLAAKPKSGS